ncbi:hypothetical protein C7212DRAFT_345394 [Tuber magnatum]|uniref:Uncharacterized protein n=1 Tax=Tuber magnatum TaxID=42249 RepID=A0A317SLS0_9PEZI|nr:hypothetical protein C7212DRAFT_345394 [Tuber magnatum]
MNPDSSSSRNRGGKQPEHPEEGGQRGPNTDWTLYSLYTQAEARKAKIERTVSQLPRIAAQAEEYLTQEMANVEDAYFEGICSEDPAEAQKLIEEAVARIQAFFNDLGNRMRADNIKRCPAPTDPGNRPAVASPADKASSQAGESSAMGARRQQQPRSLGVLPGEPENDPAEEGLMHPGVRVRVMPAPPVRRVTFADTGASPNPPSGPSLRMSRSFSFVRSRKRNSGESKSEKVKDLWKKVRVRLRKEDPSY